MNENPFRAQLAKELKNIPKEERAERLEAAQASENYWQAKSEKLDQSAEWSEDRTELSWERKNVYHGTTEPEIESFKFAEESTVLYCRPHSCNGLRKTSWRRKRWSRCSSI